MESAYEAGDKLLIEAVTPAGAPHSTEVAAPLESTMNGTDEVSSATIAGAIADLMAVWKSPGGEDLIYKAAHRIKNRRKT